jgi:hypothetical protein
MTRFFSTIALAAAIAGWVCPARWENASFNPIILKYIGFQGEIARSAGDSSGSRMLRNVDSEH